MNRNELIDAVAEATSLSPEVARRCLDALFGNRGRLGVLARALGRGDKVQLVGFGTFEVRLRPARQGHNPRTGKRMRIAARRAAVYRPASSLQVHLQEPRAPERPPGSAQEDPATHPGTRSGGRR
jgi:DNA-binding protein HU-beta